MANGVSEISISHELDKAKLELDLTTRMEVLAGIMTELARVFSMLPVSKTKDLVVSP